MKIKYEIEYKIDKFYADVYIEQFNLVIEVYGDFWHANPIKYKEDDILSFPDAQQVRAGDIWNCNNERINIIKNFGYNILIFWEYDIIHSFGKIKEELCNLLK